MTTTLRQTTSLHSPELEQFLRDDPAFNYFIRIGLLSDRPVFSEVHVEEDEDGAVVGALFRRHSGTVQFHSLLSADFAGFGRIVTVLAPSRIQGRPDLIERLAPHCPPANLHPAAWINRKHLEAANADAVPGVRELTAADLPRVVALYEQVSRGFSGEEHMRRKFETRRGRGYYLEDADHRITCIVQTEFEEDGECAIVGVATHPDHQRRGLARALMSQTEIRLAADGFREVYLQFDSEIAKRLYESMDYQPVGRVAYLTGHRRDDRGG